jgi:hypothetical protein
VNLRLLILACALLWAQTPWAHPMHAAVPAAEPPCHSQAHQAPAPEPAHDCCGAGVCNAAGCHCIGSTALALGAVTPDFTLALWVVPHAVATTATKPLVLPADLFRPPI